METSPVPAAFVAGELQTWTMSIQNSTGVVGPLPFENLYYRVMDVVASCSLFLITGGVIANIVNIVVFVKTHLADNVTVSLFVLSISDLTYLVVVSPHAIVHSVDYIFQYRLGMPVRWGVDKRIFIFPFYWYAFVFYENSILITVYISVVRCACVAMPFRVKSTFTSRRAIVTFVVFFICIFLLRLPMMMNKRIALEFDTVSNTSRLVYKEVDDGGVADIVNDIVSRNILPWTSFVIIVTSVAIMVTKLLASARFRSSALVRQTTGLTSQTTDEHLQTGSDSAAAKDPNIQKLPMPSTLSENTPSQECGILTQSDHIYKQNITSQSPREDSSDMKSVDDTKQSTHSETARQKLPSSFNKAKGQVLSPREAQVVKSVVLISVIFIVCQVPFMVYSLARRIESQFDNQRNSRYMYLFFAATHCSKLFAYINASLNIVVHYNYNSRYRQCLRSLLALDQKSST